MLDFQDAPAAEPHRLRSPAAAVPDDWLSVEEDDLRAAHAEACAMVATPAADAGMRLRYARSIVLLEQLLAARALVRMRRIAPAEARAVFRGDRSLGYFLGLAASSGDPDAAPVSERALAAALRHVHGLVFGSAEAHRLAGACPLEVGAAFGDGMLAAEADLHRFLQGHGGAAPAAMPVGLLLGLPCIASAGSRMDPCH